MLGGFLLLPTEGLELKLEPDLKPPKLMLSPVFLKWMGGWPPVQWVDCFDEPVTPPDFISLLYSALLMTPLD